MSSSLQCFGSSPYVLLNIVGPLAETIQIVLNLGMKSPENFGNLMLRNIEHSWGCNEHSNLKSVLLPSSSVTTVGAVALTQVYCRRNLLYDEPQFQTTIN